MTVDLTGGLAPEKDLVFPGRPDDPEMRESTSVWLYEENGAFGFPRMGIEAEASAWDDRRLQAAFTFPDGRALNRSEEHTLNSSHNQRSRMPSSA